MPRTTRCPLAFNGVSHLSRLEGTTRLSSRSRAELTQRPPSSYIHLANVPHLHAHTQRFGGPLLAAALLFAAVLGIMLQSAAATCGAPEVGAFFRVVSAFPTYV
jgi:hypothetical protein